MTGRTVALRCPLCGWNWSGAGLQPHMEPCPQCGVLTTIPPPQRDVFSDGLFIDGSYAGRRLAKRSQWMREAGLRLDWIRTHVQRGELLEIGAATGEFVAVASEAGFHVTGLEASTWAAEASRDMTPYVVQADPTAWLAHHPGKFDVIAFFHTLEHVHDPRAFLTPLVAALAAGGLMFIEVPNGAARDAREGEGWHGSRFQDHVLHYQDSDLQALLSSLGLNVVATSTDTMRRLDPPLVWKLRRLRWLTRGSLRPSEDILRVVAKRL